MQAKCLQNAAGTCLHLNLTKQAGFNKFRPSSSASLLLAFCSVLF
jgi:hypothetical protein